MAQDRAIRIRTTGLALAITAALGVGLALTAGPAAAATPTIKLSATNIVDGQTVKVTGTGYPSEPTNLFIAVCENPPSATDCDTDLSHVVQVRYNGSGGFKTTYTIHTTFTLSGKKIDCAKVECVVGSTNAAAPKDHSYNAVRVFTVKSASSGAAKTTKAATTTATSANPTATGTTGATGPALASTGASPITPLLGVLGLLLVIGGSGLVYANSRRRHHHV